MVSLSGSVVGETNCLQGTSTFDSTKLHERPYIQFQAAAVVVTMDADMDTSFRDRQRGLKLQLHSTFAITKKRKGYRGGAVMRAIASHQCGPGSISRLGVICGLSLLVLYSASRDFSPGTPVSPLLKKPTFDLICVIC